MSEKKIAVLIPCYNESLTVEIFLFMIITPQTTPPNLPQKPARLSATNTGRAKAMLSARCSAKLMRIVT